MELEKITSPFNLIIFGASGDLAELKLFPSIYELFLQKRFAKEFRIQGYARSEMTDEAFRSRFKKSVKTHVDPLIYHEEEVDELLKHVFYQQGEYDQAEDFEILAKQLNLGKNVKHLALLSTPPVVLKPIIENLSAIKEKVGGKLQVMIEKPFGEDVKSAKELFKFIQNHFDQEDIFLIDHYLGKAAVRSIFPLRYNNAILNLLLKGSAISNIQISALETLGVEERVGFFENVGIIKDMFQSHLIQILALLTMAMPVHQEVHSIRREKGDVISALRLDKKPSIVLGQYEEYQAQAGVKKGSETATFAALRFFIDLADWYQVPIYMRAGKKLSHKHTYIVIEFKQPAYVQNSKSESNKLIIELYPKEKIEIKLVNDIGKAMPQYTELITEESLACQGDDCLPPHANLILDAFLNRMVSFLSMDEILASWHFIDQVHERIEKEGIKVERYQANSDGPKTQEELTKMEGNQWYDAGHL